MSSTHIEKESLRERMAILIGFRADIERLEAIIEDLRSENERLRNLCNKYERIHNAL